MKSVYSQVSLYLCLTAGVAWAVGGSQKKPDPPPVSIPSELDKQLHELKGSDLGSLNEVTTDSLRTVFPNARIFSLSFRQYPSEVVPTPPLKANNLFAVQGDKVVHIASEADLAKFFVERWPKNAESPPVKDGAASWLSLAKVLRQDGFYEFGDPVVKAGATEAQGILTVKPKTGKGEINVTMKFKSGRLMEVTPGGELTPGRRPR